jgi:site-specific recombinase XerD
MTTSLQQTVERYLKVAGQALRQSSVRVKRSDLFGVIRFIESHYPEVRSWADVRRSPHIEKWLEYLHESPIKRNTRVLRIVNMRVFLNDIVNWQWPEAPPPGLIRPEDRPPEEYLLPKPLPQDVDEAVQTALARVHTLNAMGVRLLRMTGMRIGEMVDLDINALDVRDPNNPTLRVPEGKTRTERVVPLATEATTLVQSIRAKRGTKMGSKPISDLVAPYLMVNERGKRLSAYTYGRALKAAARHIATTEHIHLHRLRHYAEFRIMPSSCGAAA